MARTRDAEGMQRQKKMMTKRRWYYDAEIADLLPIFDVRTRSSSVLTRRSSEAHADITGLAYHGSVH
jgi:hypothetical protein